jgi:hypothetical protein
LFSGRLDEKNDVGGRRSSYLGLSCVGPAVDVGLSNVDVGLSNVCVGLSKVGVGLSYVGLSYVGRFVISKAFAASPPSTISIICINSFSLIRP